MKASPIVLIVPALLGLGLAPEDTGHSTDALAGAGPKLRPPLRERVLTQSLPTEETGHVALPPPVRRE